MVNGDEEAFNRGLEIRRAVVGEERVRASMSAATPLEQPLQRWVTQFAWGEIWAREGLDRRARSILTIGLLVGANRGSELKVHFTGSMNNGISIRELREIVIHSAVYSGFPAALEAMQALGSILSDEQKAELGR